MIRSTIMAAMLALLSVAAIPMTWAQTESAPTEQTTPYSDNELKSFAAAAVEVHRINSGYLPKMAEATPDQQRALEQQALRETTAAVEKQGLTSDKYDEILTAAQTRPEVATKVEQFLNKAPRPGTTQL
jgi:Domain of unknown function (DUF4168)